MQVYCSRALASQYPLRRTLQLAFYQRQCTCLREIDSFNFLDLLEKSYDFWQPHLELSLTLIVITLLLT